MSGRDVEKKLSSERVKILTLSAFVGGARVWRSSNLIGPFCLQAILLLGKGEVGACLLYYTKPVLVVQEFASCKT